MLGHLWDDGVTKGSPSGSVQPRGNPITHSRNRGFGFPPRIAGRSGLLRRSSAGLPAPRFASLAFGVGNEEQPITLVRGTEGDRRYAIPVRVIPARGQVPENVAHPPIKESCHVFHDEVSGSHHANGSHHLPPESRAGPGQAGAEPGMAKVLARETATQDVDGLKLSIVHLRDVLAALGLGPVAGEHPPAERIELDLPGHRADAGAFKPQLQAADAAE